MMNYTELEGDRITGDKDLFHVMSFGDQYLSGVFVKKGEEVTKGPMDLVWSSKSGLLQLGQTYDLREMYGETYGYRTGLNKSMVEHVEGIAQKLEALVDLQEGDLVLDIGANDGTLLKVYTKGTRLGIDPTISKFKEYYPDGFKVVPDFFTLDNYTKAVGDQKAKIVTSIACLYDLERPQDMIKDIATVLADDGVWLTEQSYMPSMLKKGLYDTVCQEHLEFYSLKVIKNLVEAEGLRIIDVTTNDTNGGSFAVTIAKKDSKYESNDAVINWMLEEEKRMGLDTTLPYLEFAGKAQQHAKALKDLLLALVARGKKVLGYGASTKGNVLLQYAGIGKDLVPYIADVNPEKWGKVTPGTEIEIISEEQAKEMKPDYYLVLPYHFKNGILQREKEYIKRGGKFIFPLPSIEII